MTSDGLGEMFEGDFAGVDGWLKGDLRVRRYRSEDSHRCLRKYPKIYINLHELFYHLYYPMKKEFFG